MTGDLQTKLNAKFAATSALTTAFPGNVRKDGTTSSLYWGAIDKGGGRDTDGSQLPCLVADVVGTPATATAYGSGTPAYGDYLISFKAIYVGMLATVAKLETLIGVMDGFRPTLAAGTVTNVIRQGDAVPMKLPPDNETGADEWQVMVTYLYTLAP